MYTFIAASSFEQRNELIGRSKVDLAFKAHEPNDRAAAAGHANEAVVCG